jgi:hypothetical protein
MVRTILYDYPVHSLNVVLDSCLSLCQSHLLQRSKIFTTFSTITIHIVEVSNRKQHTNKQRKEHMWFLVHLL